MKFKDSVNMFLIEEQNELIEESIRNGSVSNYLDKVIMKANKKAEKFSKEGRSASARAVKNTIPELESAKKDFINLEKKYSSASDSEKRALKNEYNSLKKKHSDKLKRFNGKGMATAAIAAAALAALSGSSVSNYKPDVGMDYVRVQSAKASEWQRNKDELKSKYGNDEEVVDDNLVGTYMHKKSKKGSGEELDKDMYKNVVSKKRELVDAQARYRLEQSKENYRNLSRGIREYYNFRYIDTKMTDAFIKMKKDGIKDDSFIRLRLEAMIPSHAKSSVVTENFFPY